jgi:YVTN family beta-propeller protein
LVFVRNTDDKTLSVVKGTGDTGNTVISIMGNGTPKEFGDNQLGDTQFSEGEWFFMNVGEANSVALIDPLSGATPILNKLELVGRRPVHLYRDSTNGEVVWIMNDGDAGTGLDDVTVKSINCNQTHGATASGSVTIIHNSHTGPGGHIPEIIGRVCVRAVGHKVAAFSKPTNTNPIPLRAFVSTEISGQIAVIDNNPLSANYLTLQNRIDMCNPLKELTCDSNIETANGSHPHGIRWSPSTEKVYSFQEGYLQIAEINPDTLAITDTVDLPAPYTSFGGITPDGRFLIVRGTDRTDPAQVVGKVGLIDLTKSTPRVVEPVPVLTLPNVQPGALKFSPDGKGMFLTQSNSVTGLSPGQLTALITDKLFVLDSSALPTLSVAATIDLVPAGGHSIDLLAEGAGVAKYVVVTNAKGTSQTTSPTATPNSVSVINTTTNTKTQDVPVGNNPGAVMIYAPGTAAAGNQASS